MNLSSATAASRVPSSPPLPPIGSSPHDDGWLGQVPPPAPPTTPPCHHEPEQPTYAIPQLAPDPWLEPPPLYPHDPTLFG